MADTIPDPRQADVDAVQALLDQVERDGAVQLPALSAAELGAVGAMRASLVDDQARSWWTAMAGGERATLSATALQFLVHRRLLVPPEPGAGDDAERVALEVQPLLGVILAGRTRPAFVVLRREGTGGAPDRMRLYGIADEARGLRCVLAEEATGKQVEGLGPGYLYVLASTAEAIRSLIRWIGRAPVRVTTDADQASVIEVYRPDTGAGPARRRILVTRGAAGLRIEGDRDARVIEGDEEDLRLLLSRTFADLPA